MGEIIGFLSGKGGTGKTAVCAGLAQGLSLLGESVLCIDLNAGLPGLDLALGVSQLPALTFAEVASGEYDLEQAAKHPQFAGLVYLTAPENGEPLDALALESLLEKAKQEFSYVMLDCPAGLGEAFQLAAKVSDRLIVVCGYDPDAIRCASKVGNALELLGKTNARLIINRADKQAFREMGINVDDIMDRAGLPLLGLMPEDAYVVLAANKGKPIFKTIRTGTAVAACKRIVKRIRGESIPVKL